MRLGIVTSLLLLLLADYGLGQERPPLSLELTLEIDKADLVLGEPVYAIVRLTNIGAAPVDVAKVLDPQTGDVQIDVAGSVRPTFRFLPLFYADALQARVPLAPAEKIAAAFPIFYGALGWTFERPGTYRVTAAYRQLGGTQGEPVRSNSVTVTIADEGGPRASLLERTPASEEAGKFLLWQRGDHLQQGQSLLKRLQQQYPDSPVIEYVWLAFGRNLNRAFRNYAIGRIRPIDCEAALPYLQQVQSERISAYLQIQKHIDEARCLAILSLPALASVEMRRAQALAGDRPEFRLLLQQAARLEPALQQAR